MVNSDFISIICRRTATKIFFKIYSLYLVRCEASLSLMLSQLQMRTIQKQPNKNRWKISGVCVCGLERSLRWTRESAASTPSTLKHFPFTRHHVLWTGSMEQLQNSIQSIFGVFWSPFLSQPAPI